MTTLKTGSEDVSGSTLSELLSEHEAIQRRIASIEGTGLPDETASGSLAELVSSSQHPADEAAETLEREVELGLLEDFREQRADVEGAVSRVFAGTYGTCLACGEPIGAERLRALPAATRCLNCQLDAERDHKIPGTSTGLPHMGELTEFLPSDDSFDAHTLSMEEQAMRVMKFG